MNNSVLLQIGIGYLLLMSGLLLRVSAIHEFNKAGLHGEQFMLVRPPTKIIRTGIYKYMRHPAYIGSMLCFAGIGILCLGWGGACLFVPSWPFYKERMLIENNALMALQNVYVEQAMRHGQGW